MMSPLLMLFLSIGAPFAAHGLLQLQARLEQWDAKRHAGD